ncbi:MAG: SH3 domain-containing protein [Lacunisphaera sp.]|nr:SH3 domain-containing protein [Lacunisphaera sp.]
MKPHPTPRLWLVALMLTAAATLEAALTAGGTAYTKRFETNLLAEPAPLAAVTGKVAYGRKLAIAEARGAWLRVSDGPAAGWVFAGNLSELKPAEGKGLDGLGLAASATTATAAARPLTPAADDYAARRNLTEARDDLNWLIALCATVTPQKVESFLQEQKKGEFQ